MNHYIDKDALVAEIERRIAAYQKNFDKADNKIARLSTDGRIQSLKEILSFLDTLEVKKADLTREDVSKIISIDQQVCGTMGISSYTRNHQQAMEEVLKRFKAQKGE